MKTINDCTILVVDDTQANVAVLVQALKGLYKLAVALNEIGRASCRERV